MERTLAKTKLWLVNNEDKPIIGEGKVALLESIRKEGSLNKACKKVKISYKHAWLLLKEIEDSVRTCYNKKTRWKISGHVPDRKRNKLT